MKAAAWLLAACIALTAFRAALAGLIIILAITLLWAVANKPREVASFAFAIAATSLVSRHPFACFVSVLAIAAVCALRRSDLP